MGLIIIKVMMAFYCRLWEFWKKLIITSKLSYPKTELSSLIERLQSVDSKDVTIIRFWVICPICCSNYSVDTNFLISVATLGIHKEGKCFLVPKEQPLSLIFTALQRGIAGSQL